MIPSSNIPSSLPIGTHFASPEELKASKWIDYERGGSGFRNPYSGLDVQTWKMTYDGQFVRIVPEVGDPTTIAEITGIKQLTFAFDSDMEVHFAYTRIDNNELWVNRWNADLGVRETISVGTGRSPRMALDDRRPSQVPSADVVLAFLRDTAYSSDVILLLRSEVFETEHAFGSVSLTTSIRAIGMSRNWRMQLELI